MNGLPAWTARAACRDADPRLWFVEPGGRPADRALARLFCRRCPVRPDCLALAMDAEEGLPAHKRHGVFGGLGPTQRYELEQRGRRAAS